MKTVAMLPLSTSQRIVTIEVGSGDERRWLVLGVTPNSITRAAHDGAARRRDRRPAVPIHPAFAQILGRLRRPGAGDPGAR